MSILIGIFTFALILVSLFLVLVILAQKSKNDGGMGAALGGGMTEATFGADTGNVLTKSTINATIAFFVLSFGLYLAQLHKMKAAANSDAQALPTVAAPAAPAAAATTTTPAADATATTTTTAPAAKADQPATTTVTVPAKTTGTAPAEQPAKP